MYALVYIKKHTIRLLLIFSAFLNSVTQAGVLQVNAGVQNGHFVHGVDLTNGEPSLTLGLDWSGDNGFFTGANCYDSESSIENPISYGCQAYAGYFLTLNEHQAIGFDVKRSEYARTEDPQWDSWLATIDWHINRTTVLSLGYSDDWLGRGFESVQLDLNNSYHINDKFSLESRIGVLELESGAPIDNLPILQLGVEYKTGRWSAGLHGSFIRSDIDWLIPFASNEPEIIANLRYRLY